MKKSIQILFLLGFLVLLGCGKPQIKLVDKSSFEKIVDGKHVSLYTLQNIKGDTSGHKLWCKGCILVRS